MFAPGARGTATAEDAVGVTLGIAAQVVLGLPVLLVFAIPFVVEGL